MRKEDRKYAVFVMNMSHVKPSEIQWVTISIDSMRILRTSKILGAQQFEDVLCDKAKSPWRDTRRNEDNAAEIAIGGVRAHAYHHVSMQDRPNPLVPRLFRPDDTVVLPQSLTIPAGF